MRQNGATAMFAAANAVAADEEVADHLREAASGLSTLARYVALGNYGAASSALDPGER